MKARGYGAGPNAVTKMPDSGFELEVWWLSWCDEAADAEYV